MPHQQNQTESFQLRKLEFDLEQYRRDGIRSLLLFSKAMWSVLEKSEFKTNWHIEAICEHLQAVTNGEIRNLIINMPPRHMKSLLVSVFWPTWMWLKNPEKRYIFASYSQSLSTRDAVKMRTLIRSDKFQTLYKPEWHFKDDQDTKMKFENTETGYRISTSVGGLGTGEGGDVICADDPMNSVDAESEVEQKRVIDWWDTAMSSRGNDPKTVAKVIVMQRLHEKDLCGHVLKDFKKDYDTLILPAEYKPQKKIITSIGWSDPRTKENELLWESRFDSKWINDMKTQLGPKSASGQLDQDPMPGKGGTFKREWWKRYTRRPMPDEILFKAQYWDCASVPGVSNDYSVCATWAKTAQGYFLLDIWREKVAWPQLEEAFQTQYSAHQPHNVKIEFKSAGISLFQWAQQKTFIPVEKFEPGQKDKVVRASHATPIVAAQRCYLPLDAPWVEDFIKEHERFPLAEHDDQVDTTAMMADDFEGTLQPDYGVRQL